MSPTASDSCDGTKQMGKTLSAGPCPLFLSKFRPVVAWENEKREETGCYPIEQLMVTTNYNDVGLIANIYECVRLGASGWVPTQAKVVQLCYE